MTEPAADQVLDRLDPQGAGMLAVCQLYRMLLTRGMSHDQIADRLQHVHPALLRTPDGQINDGRVAELAESFAPVKATLARTETNLTDNLLTALALIDADLTGDQSAVGLLPECSAASAALHQAQAGVAAFLLRHLTPGQERRFLTAYRHQLVLASTPTDTPGDTE